MEQKSTDAESDLEQMICPTCHALNPTFARRCESCGAPLDSSILLGPMGQIEAQGIAFAEATRGRPRLIVVAGIWMICLPVVLGCLLVLGLEFFSGSRTRGSELLQLVVPGILGAGSAALMLTVTWRYMRRGVDKPRNAQPGATDNPDDAQRI